MRDTDWEIPAPESPTLPTAELFNLGDGLRPALIDQPPLVHGQSADIRIWFDGAVIAAIPAHDGTLETSRAAAQAYAKHAKADNTRRAYRAGVRAWCDWCHRHALPDLPTQKMWWPSWPSNAAVACPSPPSSYAGPAFR